MWVAHGFLKPVSCKSLEEVAKAYLKELVDRNLILLRRDGLLYCVVHDLVRDLCVKESLKERLRRIPRTQVIGDLPRRALAKGVCFLCTKSTTKEKVLYLTELHLGLQTSSLVSALVCEDCRFHYPEVIKLRLVRIKLTSRDSNTKETFLHTKLRYITKQTYEDINSAFPAALHLLWNLLTFEMLGLPYLAPLDMWEMPQLRHVELDRCILPDLPLEIVSDDLKVDESRKNFTVLENLQTLQRICNFRFTKEVVERIPNLRKLGIRADCYLDKDPSSFYSFHNLVQLHKLESLTMSLYFRLKLGNIAFPKSLRKLTLEGCMIPWEDMKIVGSLPNLEKLNLHFKSFVGPEWNLVEEGQFQHLKSLCMSNLDLVHWNAGKTHFPVLENLKLQRMTNLEEIPMGIGDIDTLHSISIYHCNDPLVESAKQILEDQQSYGNNALQVTFYLKVELFA